MNAAIATQAVHEILDASGFSQGDLVASRQVLCLAVGRETCGMGMVRRSAIVIVETCHHDQEGVLVVGALVDGVSEVLDVPLHDIEPVPPLDTRIPWEFLQGMAKAKGTLLSRESLAALIGGHIGQLGRPGLPGHAEPLQPSLRAQHAPL